MNISTRALFVIGLGFGLIVGCGAAHSRDDQSKVSTLDEPAPIAEVSVGQYGIACKSFSHPDTAGPATYSVNDIGKGGVPSLSEDQRLLVIRIQKYVKSKTLRFAFVDRPNLKGRFIVFEANEGPCMDGPARVLNGFSNENYEPGQNPFNTFGLPMGFTPGPWMPASPRP